MRNVLLVDDDPLVVKIYQDGLRKLGVQVQSAVDGLDAIRALREHKPDVVVLDLMMPKLSGADVLKFIRSEPKLRTLPVVVLSNSYMNDLAAQAASLGVQTALVKVRCSPAILFEAINDAVEGRVSRWDPSLLIAAPEQSRQVPQPSSHPAGPAAVAPAPAASAAEAAAAEFHTKARQNLLENAHATCAALRSLRQAFAGAPDPAEREPHLQALYRKVHFIATIAGQAECHRLTQMSTAFEALLFELSNRPAALSPSILRTIAGTVDFLARLFDCALEAEPEAQLSAQALVVDDDPLSNRLVASALQRAQIQACCAEDPLKGLQWLQERHFDLVLLDIGLPGMDGFELCRRLRLLPGYAKTPVIYVTARSDFEHRARSVLSGGNDLIAKPVFPMDLAVKAVALLLRGQLKHA